jgi:hypothetical protein
MIKQAGTDQGLLNKVTTGDGSWNYEHDRETSQA